MSSIKISSESRCNHWYEFLRITGGGLHYELPLAEGARNGRLRGGFGDGEMLIWQ
jgi:hypothetical protein